LYYIQWISIRQEVWTKKISTGYAVHMSEESRKHSQGVLLRFEPDQLEMIDRAADLAGLNRTAWLRALAIREARREVGEHEAPPPKRGRSARYPGSR
jgi:transketolase